MYLCVTNRKQCNTDFLEKIEALCHEKDIDKIILREKDLTEETYQILAEQCFSICKKNKMPLVINHFFHVAKELGIEDVQVSMATFLQETNHLEQFQTVGVSIHSLDEAIMASTLGADYLIAGHIFPTDCKKGVPPRGLHFLKEVCDSVSIPVYGIGGISKGNIQEVLKAGAAGGCMMSGFMK